MMANFEEWTKASEIEMPRMLTRLRGCTDLMRLLWSLGLKSERVSMATYDWLYYVSRMSSKDNGLN